VNSRWQDLARRIGRVALREAPRFFRDVAKSRGTAPSREPARREHRVPVSSAPSASVARTISYAPQPDGQADPGEIVWAWVAYEDDPARGKDRPVLVVGRDGGTVLGLMLSSQSEREGQRNWLALGPGPWDREARPSWIRLDRVLQLDEAGIRREGAVLDPARFDSVARRLRASYGWR
jgi:hypothetical protein